MESPESDELFRRALALPAVAAVMRQLSEGGEERVALVGGAVRDLILGLPVEDIDLAVEGPVEPIVAALGGPARSHIRFGTATVQTDGGRVDLARTRRESYPRPGALPEVEPARLEEDLRRRDFTVNALALPLTGPATGRLVAVAGAIDDLERGCLRVLQSSSFVDDPTRLLRLARYQARLGFDVESATEELVRRAIAADALPTVTGPRIGHELELLSAEDDPVAAWAALRDLGLDAAIEAGFGVREDDVAVRALRLLPVDGRPEVILLALALDGVPEAGREALLDRLGIPGRVRDDAVVAAGRASGVADALGRATRASEILAAVGDTGGPELVALAGALGAEAPAREWLDRLRHLRLEIDGNDLLAAGVAPGPAVGNGLASARAALLDGRASGRAEQLAEALRVAQRSG